jgi:hemolysin activation/secretion protein
MNHQTLTRTRSYLAVSLALSSGIAMAQAIPDSGAALRLAQPPALPAKPDAPLPRIGGAPQTIVTATSTADDMPTVQVKTIVVVGNHVIDTATIFALVADGAGKTLTLGQLEQLAQRITRHYRNRGYFVARAYVPAQEVADGAVTIRVVEGNYGSFRLNNQSRVRDDIVQSILDSVKQDNIVSVATLERAMLIINDTPGVRVTRADVMPGQAVGTSDFAVDTAASAPYSGYVVLDNHGSLYTGRERLSFNADVHSVTGRGDRLSISGLGTNNGDLINGRLAYSLPLAGKGLRGELAYSQTQYALGSSYASLEATGTARALDAIVTYPMLRTQALTVEASLDLSRKRLDDQIGATDTRTGKVSTAATAGLSLRDERALLGLNGVTKASIDLSIAYLDINDAAALASDRAGPRTQGNFRKVVASISRVSLLPQQFSLTTSLKLQQSLGHKNLDGSERMAVSGASAVMAYPSGELIGSNGALARVELARPLPAWGRLQSSWLAFADWGTAKAADPLPSDVNRRLSDVGIGWSANYGGALLRAHLAHRLQGGAATSEPFARNKVFAQAGWIF